MKQLLIFLCLFLLFPLCLYGQTKRDTSAFKEPKAPFSTKTFPYPQREFSYLPVKATRVIFPSTVKSPVARNNTVPAILFEPTLIKTDSAIVLLAWWKEHNTKKISLIGSLLAVSGIKVLFIPLAYQYERAPKGVGSGSWTVSTNIKRTRSAIVQSVKDIRRGATWLLKTQKINPRKLGLMGISLGGFVGALAYGVDKRFSSAVILLAGGNYKLMLKTQLSRFAGTRDAEKVRKLFAQHKKEMERDLPFLDPMTYADRKRGSQMLMINGLFDPIVPYICARSLKKAYGAPMITLPCGHYTAIAFVPYILPRAILHFKKQFRKNR